MKKTIIVLIFVVIAGVGIYLITKNSNNSGALDDQNTVSETASSTAEQNATTTEVVQNPGQTVIGQSVEDRDILAYHYGQGQKELLFVGGIHGGYEWNSVLVAYQLSDYLKKNPEVIPENLKVTIIPVLNPDGLDKVVGTTTGDFTAKDVPASSAAQVAGRFNANKVDLNRNFDCDWKANGTWQNQTVSGGSAPFSEPESLALKNYVETNKPAAVIAWYSAAGGVYASTCSDSVSSATSALTKAYAKASGYPAYESFDSYKVTGDMVNWVTKKDIPAISVLLTNHTDTEWSKNLAGIKAVLNYYAE